MYECLKCMIDWQFDREVSQRQTKHWKIGHVVARAATYSQGKTSLEKTVVERRIESMAEGNKLVEEGPLEGPWIQVAVARRVSAG